MTTQDKAPARPKLAFGTAIATAHESVFGRFRRFAKLAAAPFALMLLVGALKIPVGQYITEAEVALFVLDLLPFAILGVAQSRAVLLGEVPGLLPPQPLGRRTWVYLGYSLLMVLIGIVPLAILVLGAISITYVVSDGGGDYGSGTWLTALGFLGCLLLFWVVARLSLVYPALSIDQKLGLAGAWRLSRGSGLKLVGILVVIFLVVMLVGAVGATVLGTNVNVALGGVVVLAPGVTMLDALIERGPALLWGALVSVVGYGLTMGAYASAFAQLSGWGAPRQDILERFE